MSENEKELILKIIKDNIKFLEQFLNPKLKYERTEFYIPSDKKNNLWTIKEIINPNYVICEDKSMSIDVLTWIYEKLFFLQVRKGINKNKGTAKNIRRFRTI